MTVAAWRLDASVVVPATALLVAYLGLTARFGLQRAKRWPVARTAAFALGVASVFIVLESPLDRAGDEMFVPHMIQHLVLTDLAAPLLLLGAPLLLVLGAVPTRFARAIVRVLHGRVMHVVAFPVVTWSLFIVTLWGVHFSGFFEAALRNESLHVLEHALYLGTALLFWLPIIAIGPTPWTEGPLSFPMRMLYLLIAMPAEGFLGFAIYGSNRVLYPSYASAGPADQQAAGELMWIGSGLAMFVAFMLVALEWARHDERRSLRADARADAQAASVAV